MSFLTPKAGQELRTRELLDLLAECHRELPGCLTSYTLAAVGRSHRLSRVAVWRHPRCANAAATTEHDLVLRSELRLAVVPGSDEERAFDVDDPDLDLS
jgi:hypothetical protein